MNGWVLLLCALGAPGCAARGTEQTQGRPIAQAEELLRGAKARSGDLELSCTPAEAQVSVDGVERGTCSDFASRPLRLGAGLHRVQVKKQGLTPFETYVDPSGTRARLDVALAPAPKTPGDPQ